MGKLRTTLVVLLIIACFAGAFFVYGSSYFASAGPSTDKAFVDGDLLTIKSRVSSTVESISVAAHQHVQVGDVLAVLDHKEIDAELNTILGRLAESSAEIEKIEGEIQLHQHNQKRNEIELEQRVTEMGIRSNELDRLTSMFKKGVVAGSQLDGAKLMFQEAQANVSQAHLAVESSALELVILQKQLHVLEAKRRSVMLEKEQLTIKKSFHTIVSPVAGRVTVPPVSAGEQVNEGATIVEILPDEKIWLTAYFKETDMAEIFIGAAVDVSIDAFPSRQFRGEVDSIAPIAGAKLSAVTPNYTSGNFTRVTQRVPVYITLTTNTNSAFSLQPGLSARVKVLNDTR